MAFLRQIYACIQVVIHDIEKKKALAKLKAKLFQVAAAGASGAGAGAAGSGPAGGASEKKIMIMK